MSRYSLAEFVNKNAQRDRGQGVFELESERLLEINLCGTMWTKTGSMVACNGEIKFTRDTDPNATVAWSGNLTPEFKTDVSLKTFLGRGSGESLQMRFAGDGFVVVQPSEEVYMQGQSR